MLSSIGLKNFKSFADSQIPLKPMTVNLGPNGAGKSSLIQAVLLLRQHVSSLGSPRIALNGPLVRLGTGRDVLRQGADEEVIEITLRNSDSLSGRYSLGYEPDADVLELTSGFVALPEITAEYFTYLTAERVGPRLVSPRSVESASRRDMGTRGEGALAVLEQFRAEILPDDDPRRGGRSGSIEELFQSYLACISPTARIDLHPYGNVDSIGSTFTFTPPGGIPGLPLRPTNVGFGLSYALPIIVAALVAQPGGMLIVENPEAHLHTNSQRAMTELLVRTAASGVQVIVETHSRETFHWIRKAASAGEIDGSRIGFNYFQAKYEGGDRVTECASLISAGDSLANWPQNFYDEYGSPGDLVTPVEAPRL